MCQENPILICQRLTFQGNMKSLKCKPTRTVQETGCLGLLATCTSGVLLGLHHQDVAKLHGITAQKKPLFIVMAVRSSDQT
jgi:hypothetical protein